MKDDKKKIRLGILEKELPIEDMQINGDPCYFFLERPSYKARS